MAEKKESLWLRLESKLSRHPIWIIGVVLILTVFFAYFLATNTKIDNDTETMIPDKNQVKILNNQVKEVFGDSAGIAIAIRNPKGMVRLDTLKKITEITRKIEVLDNKILMDKLRKILPGFDLNQQKAFISMVHEGIYEVKNAKQFSKYLKDEDRLSEHFDENKDLNAIKKLAVDTKKVEQLYTLFTYKKDKQSKWGKRVRKVSSIHNVDYVFSEFTDTKKLKDFFVKKQITPEAAVEFSGYLIEKSFTTVNNLKEFFNNSPLYNKAGRLLGLNTEDLKRIQNLNNAELTEWLSIIQSTPKQIKVSDLVDWKKLEANPEKELFLISERMKTWDMYANMLYSARGTAIADQVTMISVEMVPQIILKEREDLIRYVEETVKNSLKGTGLEYYIAGEPVVTTMMGQNMVQDMGFLFPIVIMVIALFLYLSFRHWRGVFLPMLTVVVTVIWTLGTIAVLNFSISLISTILPVLMVAVGSAYGIHIIHHYYEDRALGISKEEALKKTLRGIGGAVVMAGLTTIAGFGSLGTNIVVPIKEFGLFAAIGIVYALIISLAFIPSLLRIGKLPRKLRKLKVESEEYFEEAHSGVERFLEKLGKWTIHKHHYFFVALVLITVFAIWGTTKLKVEVNSIEMFKEGTPIKKADSFIKENLAGTSTFDIIIDTGKANGILDYEFLRRVESLQKDIGKDPMVGKVVTVADSIKKMHQTMNYGNPDFYRIPYKIYGANGEEQEITSPAKRKKAIAAIILSYINQFDSDDTRRMLDQNKQKLKFAIILRSGSTTVTEKLTDKVKILAKTYFNRGEKLSYAGVNPLVLEVNTLLVKGQVLSIITSALIVIFLVAFMQRSLLVGLVSIIPLGLAIIINFGLMGIFGVHLDVGTSIISNIAIGIGVDYTIHYLSGYISLIRKGEKKLAATIHTTVRSGKAILINAVSVAAGFSVLCLSTFVPILNTGWLISLTMITTSLSSLTFIPVILNRFKKIGKVQLS